MELHVCRQRLPASTPGELKLDAAHFCWTLEDPIREVAGEPVEKWKVQNDTAIPAGRYRLTIDWSTRFKRMMLHVLDVPGFSGIRIHNGVTTANTEGCLLSNYKTNPEHPDWLLDFDRQAMHDLEARVQEVLDRGEEAWITYHNPEEP